MISFNISLKHYFDGKLSLSKGAMIAELSASRKQAELKSVNNKIIVKNNVNSDQVVVSSPAPWQPCGMLKPGGFRRGGKSCAHESK